MTTLSPRPDRADRAAARRRHPTARATPDGRGPKPPAGRRTGLFLVVLFIIAALVGLGVVMGLSASTATSLSDTSDAWSLFQRQLLWTGLGAIALLVTLRVDYHRWRPLATIAVGVTVVLLIAVRVPGLGVSVNGATRWLGAGPLQMQPSEPAKLALILFIADVLARPSRRIDDLQATFRPVMVVTGLMAVLLMLQPHLGATMIIGAIALVMLFLAGTPVLPLAGMAAVGGAGGAAALALSPWRRSRFLAFMDPWDDPDLFGYQPLQSLHAITAGGLTGVGLGASRAKWGFLPYAHTDFIFAIIAEELGLLGASVVVIGFIGLACAGYAVALRAPDRFGMLLAVGITTWIFVQAVLNMGAVMSLLPVTGVTLPFLSFGGSSLVVTMAASGVLLNVARQGR